MVKTNKQTKILVVSGIVIAMYAAIMSVNVSFASGTYQIRFATSLYSLSYFYPFLIIPLGLANFISNFLFGGLGPVDMLGGTIVGILTSGGIYLVRKFRLPTFLVVPIIILVPGLLVSVWLAPIVGVPYLLQVFRLCLGQTPPALLGYLLIKTLSKMEFFTL